MTNAVTPAIRSYLYVPGDSGNRLVRAGMRGADAVIVDLEDSVAPAHKAAARAAAAAWIAGCGGTKDFECWLRINRSHQGIADLYSVFRSGLAGVCLAKTSGGAEVQAAATALADLESRHDCPIGSTALMPLIESGIGLRHIDEIAQGPRVRALQLGEIDLAADLGLPSDPQPDDLAPLRSTIVVASAAAGLQPPVGAVSTQIHAIDLFRTTTTRLKLAGFLGRAAIHPAQIPVIHDVFSISPEELAAARATVSHYDDALAMGEGVATDGEGQMIDEATVRTSRRIITLASAQGLTNRKE